MDRCTNHPDRTAPYRCMKHGISMCAECIHCRDPKIYCKFRSSCAIHFMENKNFDSEEPRSAAGGAG